MLKMKPRPALMPRLSQGNTSRGNGGGGFYLNERGVCNG